MQTKLAKVIFAITLILVITSCNSYSGDSELERDSVYTETSNSNNLDTGVYVPDESSSQESNALEYEKESTVEEPKIEMDEVEESSSKNKKTYKCLYCSKKIRDGDGVEDECNYAKDINGRRINTGLNYLLGVGPSFCNQSCFDKFHEREHDGHDVIF